MAVEIVDKETKIDLNHIVRKLKVDESTGAISIYVGVVKGKRNGREVSGILYEIRKDSLAKLKECVNKEVLNANVKSVYVVHYKGFRRPGDVIMVIGTSSETRDEAFNVTKRILDRIKKVEPLKKTEILK